MTKKKEKRDEALKVVRCTWGRNLPAGRAHILCMCMGALLGGIAPTIVHASTYIADNVSMDYVYANADDDPDCRPAEYAGQSFQPTSAFWESGMRGIGVAAGSQLIDPYPQWAEFADEDSNGRDHANGNIDARDAVFIGVHGKCYWIPANCEATQTCVCNQWHAVMATKQEIPYPALECRFSASALKLGDDDAEFADVYSCYSNEPSFASQMVSKTPKLHQWHGFYGLSNTAANTHLDDYVDDAHDGPASYAWVENMTVFDVPSLDGFDICGTSLVRGTTNGDAYTRLAGENYHSSTYGDPAGTGKAYHYVCGCYPHHPNELPIGC